MAWQQHGGAYPSAGRSLSPAGTYKLLLNTPLPGYRAEIVSGGIGVYGSGPFRVTGQALRASGTAPITALLRKNGVATNLAVGTAGVTSTFTADVYLSDSDVLELWVTWAATADSISGASASTFLHFAPTGSTYGSVSVPVGRAAVF